MQQRFHTDKKSDAIEKYSIKQNYHTPNNHHTKKYSKMLSALNSTSMENVPDDIKYMKQCTEISMNDSVHYIPNEMSFMSPTRQDKCNFSIKNKSMVHLEPMHVTGSVTFKKIIIFQKKRHQTLVETLPNSSLYKRRDGKFLKCPSLKFIGTMPTNTPAKNKNGNNQDIDNIEVIKYFLKN